MTYLVPHIWWLALCAALLGLFVGWVIWGLSGRRKLAAAVAEGERRQRAKEKAFDTERDRWARTLQKVKETATETQRGAEKINLSLSRELERDRQALGAAQTEVRRLSEAGLVEREAYEHAKAGLQNKLDAERRAKAEAETATRALREDMTKRLAEKQAELVEIETSLGEAVKAAEVEAEKLRSEVQHALAQERQARADAKDQIQRLETALRDLGKVERSTASNLEINQLELEESRRRVGELESERAELKSILADLRGRAIQVVAEPTRERPRFTTDAPRPKALFDQRPEIVDDLKEVKGIGPVMERLLNKIGCYQLRQLANFSGREVEWVAAAINAFPNRIERDRWIEQARNLHLRKYGQRHDTTLSDESKSCPTETGK